MDLNGGVVKGKRNPTEEMCLFQTIDVTK